MWRRISTQYFHRLRLRCGLSPYDSPSCNGNRCVSNAASMHAIPSPRTILTKDSLGLENLASLDDLFRYTSGRWLVDEKAQQQQRYVKFDLDRLCRIAAAHFPDATKCVRVVKMEGNFNKALLLTMDDGNEVIAKIPCPNAGLPSLTTASEVATSKFLRSRTSIRVPKVLSWSSDAANPVGAEFIIMEKIRGVPLFEAWESMDTLERYKIIDRVVQMERELANISFPASGNLFLRDSLPATYQQHPLSPELDPEGLFCIGPSCKRTWWHDFAVDMSQPSSIDVGPWTPFSEYALSIARQEFSRIERSGADVQRQLHKSNESQSIDEYKSLLEKASMIMPILSQDTRVADVSDSVLWHPDLHLGNIFVSPTDPGTIEGIIDWQSSQACPLFIQAQFPEFLTPPKDYICGPDLPTLPAGFNDLSPEQQEEAKREKELASRSKYYEMATLAHNQRAHNAMKLDRRLWEPFTYCQLFSHGSLVPLRECLIRLSQDWSALELPGNCPFLFTETELRRHDEQKLHYKDMCYLWDVVKDHLLTDNAGWVPNDRWEATEKANGELYSMFVEIMSEELSPEAASKRWPFPPV